MKNGVVYIHDEHLCKEIDKLPFVEGRASVVYDLINSYGLLESNVTVIGCTPANYDELKEFHATAYLDCIKNNDVNGSSEFGLSYDCPLLPNLYDLIRLIAGSTVSAVKLLREHKFSVAINWYGGWHHAQRDEAEGFCYVNDVVIGIQLLTEVFPKVLYVDLDVHHGNGVQNAFAYSSKVLTLSFHKYSRGFYPGSGDLNDIGCGKGKYYTLNVPFLEGCNDKSYLKYFCGIFLRVFEAYKPSVLVVQCGGDVINGDPIGEINVTPKVMGICISEILKCNLPTLFLGGGGYNIANTSRYWTYLTSLILKKSIDDDIPDSSEYFTEYKPTYELHIDEGTQKDYNDNTYIDSTILTISHYCNLILSK
ncbi:hypothetical protein FQA39_LY10341 [Lamprigera yunnana]|nr:hypothetical protein FQA39_LY10341 [Lamprigera yunnana]